MNESFHHPPQSDQHPNNNLNLGLISKTCLEVVLEENNRMKMNPSKSGATYNKASRLKKNFEILQGLWQADYLVVA